MNSVWFGVRLVRKTVGFVLVSVFVVSGLVVSSVEPVGAQGVTIRNFTSPSGNIHCLLVVDENGSSADCSVLKATWPKPKSKPADCDLDWDPLEIVLNVEGSIATIQEGGCRGDIGPYCPPGCPPLQYGSATTVGKIRCTSLQEGIKCQATAGKRKGLNQAEQTGKKHTNVI
jgi:hypothetical protein